ncbi:MAG: CPBP family intramembrane metalloprotease [Asgard group archaeon]|nr:CPBP family intramembrane metalloprotease [Asgard group archaeon]
MSLVLYFFLTLIWSWSLQIPSILKSYEIISPPDWLITVLSIFALFGPTIIATIITAIYYGKEGLKNLYKKGIETKFKKIYLLPTLLLGLVITGVAFALSIAIFGYTLEENYYNIGFFVGAVLIAFFTGGPLAEEFGWRGFALEKLQKHMGALSASFLLGAIWGIWHLPMHFISGTTQSFIPFIFFIPMIMFSSVIYTWLYNNTNGSVLIAMLFHWTTNIGAAVFPYWQLGIINGRMPNNIYFPTYGMLIGFGVQLMAIIIIIILTDPKTMQRQSKEVEPELTTI